MTKRNDIYRCKICGNIVSVMHEGVGELMCCKEKMTLLQAGIEDAAVEKHVPFATRNEDGIHVQVGGVMHPMEEDHYIEWITLVTDNKSKTVFLSPGDNPEAMFATTSEKVSVYAYCNLHGLWKLDL
jgi:superoxide reductase